MPWVPILTPGVAPPAQRYEASADRCLDCCLHRSAPITSEFLQILNASSYAGFSKVLGSPLHPGERLPPAMAAGQAPLPLAELICELAAPDQRPTILKMQAQYEEAATLTLVLRVQPRQHAAGLEVAAHVGFAHDEDEVSPTVASEGALYSVNRTWAGVAAFARDLVAAAPAQWDAEYRCESFRALRLQPEDEYGIWLTGWGHVELELYPADAVVVDQDPDVPEGQVRVRFPSVYYRPPSLLATAMVPNGGESYAKDQRSLRGQAAHRAANSGAGGSGVAAAHSRQPDSEEVQKATVRRLNAEATESLVGALAAMLRQACRYRGSQAFPGAGGAAAQGPPQQG